jgi:hypothetical protein
MPAPTRKPPTPAQVQAEQRRVLEADQKRQAAAANLPAKVETKLPAAPDTRSAREQYLDEIAPASMVGRMVKFAKEGRFITPDDDAEISGETDFIALVDQTLVGWIKFNGQGEAPDREMGLLYDGFIMPARASLGDSDPSKWELGLNGQPADPWQHQICLVLQNVETAELFTYATSSITGRRAIGNLLRHYDRMVKTHPDHYPIVRLKVGGFQHRDDRVGWVPTPVVATIGRKPREDAAAPDKPNTKADFQDEISF